VHPPHLHSPHTATHGHHHHSSIHSNHYQPPLPTHDEQVCVDVISFLYTLLLVAT
jgi:hypothetical protein